LTQQKLLAELDVKSIHSAKEFPAMIPSSALLDQSTIATLLDYDPVVSDYRHFFSLLDWNCVKRWEAQQSPRGRPSHPETAYLKAFLLRIREGLISTSGLRRFLLKHPLLVIELGFHLVPDPHALYRFDPERTLPSDQWFRHKLRTFDPLLLQTLLASTVHDLQEEIPGLGEVVAFDVKHIYAWVKENNWRTYVRDRYDKHQIPIGDPDCRLGVKRSTNQEQPDGSTKAKKELIWGYGSGVAAATTPDYGDVVLAEYTQPFNEGDATYFRPLYQQAVVALSHFPTHVTADAAFDAWYVYEVAARHGGIGAVPLNGHGHHDGFRDRHGVPICRKGLRMLPSFQFAHPNGYRAQRFLCPLLFPHPTRETCDHEQFLKGLGCKKDPLYKAIYTQRTSCERINSQAQALGIERPKVRNRRSVANLNTLIYVIINVRALNRAKTINKGLLQLN
jgi:hypothetical protein